MSERGSQRLRDEIRGVTDDSPRPIAFFRLDTGGERLLRTDQFDS